MSKDKINKDLEKDILYEAVDTVYKDNYLISYQKMGSKYGKKKSKSKKEKSINSKNNDNVTSKYSSISSDYKENSKKNNLNKRKKALKKPLSPKEKRKRALIITLIIFASIVFLYLVGVIIFSFRFGFNTYINGENVSFKSVKQTEKIVENQVDNYNIVIKASDGKKEFIDGDDIDIEFVKDNKIKSVLRQKGAFLWPKTIFIRDYTMHHATIRYDKSKLTNIINKMEIMDEKTWKAPIDAFPRLTKNGYIVQKEYIGTTINKDKIYNTIEKAVDNTENYLDLLKENVYIMPNVFWDSSDLVEQVKMYNTWLDVNIDLVVLDKKKRLGGNIILTWFDREQTGELVLNQSKIIKYISALQKKYNTVGIARNFKSVDGNTYQVKGGTYGFEINDRKLLEDFINIVNLKQSATIEVDFKRKGAVLLENNQPDWGNTYIEVNLTTQHMYLIKDNNIVLESDIVTGTPNSRRTTPDGVYDILEKKRNAVLVGEIQENGEPEYRTPVAYWLRMTWGGVGFHTATWQPYFGGNVYTWNGSHGCINMPYAESESLYNLCDVGTPVVCHY